MTPFIIILILFLIGFYTQKDKFFFFLCGLCMLLIVALRAKNVGADTSTYMDMFSSESYYHPLEPLWEIYQQFVFAITNNPQLFIAITAIITLVPLFYFFRNNSVIPLLSLFVYFILPNDQGYIFSMSGLRQALAATIVMYFFAYINDKKWITAAIFATAAFCIHNSSIIVVIGVALVYFIQLNQKTSIISLIVIVVATLFQSFISVADIFSIFKDTSISQIEFIEDYSFYTTYLQNAYDISMWGMFNLTMPIFLMFILLTFNPNILNTLYAKLYLFGGLFLCIMSNVPMVGRYFLYFIMLETLLIPQIYVSKSYKYNKQFCMLLLSYQTVILLLYLYFNNAHGLDWDIRRVTPYYFFFNTPY